MVEHDEFVQLEKYQRWRAGQDELRDWAEIENMEVKNRLLRKPVKSEYTRVTRWMTVRV